MSKYVDRLCWLVVLVAVIYYGGHVAVVAL